MKLYVVSLESSYITCGNVGQEQERKGFTVLTACKSNEAAEQFIQGKLDELETCREKEPNMYRDYTRYKHGCHYICCFTVGSDNWFIMERVSAQFNITETELQE